MDPVSRAQQSTGINEKLQRGKAPQSLANLRPFPKGVSGNPSGRPKRKKYASKVYAELFRDKEFRAAFKQSVRDVVTAGRGMAVVLMAREITERLEGPMTQSLEITGEVTLVEAVRNIRERKEQLIELRNAS